MCSLVLIDVWFAHDVNYKTKSNAAVTLAHFADALSGVYVCLPFTNSALRSVYQPLAKL